MTRLKNYRKLLEALDDQTVYTPSTIATFAVAEGFIEEASPAETAKARQRCRLSFGRLLGDPEFHEKGDGLVRVPGQAPTPGWFGWRYKAAAANGAKGTG